MNGLYALAGALLVTTSLLGVGAGDSLFQNLDDRYDHYVEGEEHENFYVQEQLVEGHTTYAVLTVVYEDDEQPTEPTKKRVECEETNPGDPVWPYFEDCEAEVGPIEGFGPVERVEEVHADVRVSTGDEAPAVGNPDEGFWDGLFNMIPWV